MAEFYENLPDIGEGVVEGEIVEWFVEIGSYVETGDPIVSVMTDKATVEVPYQSRNQKRVICTANLVTLLQLMNRLLAYLE